MPHKVLSYYLIHYAPPGFFNLFKINTNIIDPPPFLSTFEHHPYPLLVDKMLLFKDPFLR